MTNFIPLFPLALVVFPDEELNLQVVCSVAQKYVGSVLHLEKQPKQVEIGE